MVAGQLDDVAGHVPKLGSQLRWCSVEPPLSWGRQAGIHKQLALDEASAGVSRGG